MASIIIPGTALVGDVLAGKIFSAGTNYQATGTMVDRGTVSTDITTKAQQVTIAAGKHSGSGIVQISATEQAKIIAGNIKSGITLLGQAGNSNVVDTSAGTAVASQILNGAIAFVDGAQVTGTIPSKGTATITPGTSDQTIASGQYLSGVQTIIGDADLVAANILNTTTIFGVTGSAIPETTKVISNGQLYQTNFTIYNCGGGTKTVGVGFIGFSHSVVSDGRLYYSTAVDLTNFTTIYLSAVSSTSSNHTLYFIASTSQNAEYTVYDARVGLTCDGSFYDYTLDVSALNGVYYLRFNSVTTVATTKSITFRGISLY